MPEKNNDYKNDPKPWKKKKIELLINNLETRIQKMQEMFNRDLEWIKKSQLKMNNAINEIKNNLEETNSRIMEAE